MSGDVARILTRIDEGDFRAAEELLPMVYNELRRLAKCQLELEAPGQSLQSADLVHEAYLRLVGSDQKWESWTHFLGAAAEAMRRILVERARKKQRLKYGGRRTRVELTDSAAAKGPPPDEVIAVSDLLEALSKRHPLQAQLVKLHYFAGFNISEAGRVLGLSSSTAHRHWVFARAWLCEAMRGEIGMESGTA